MYKYLFIILFIAGCMSPMTRMDKFVAKYQDEPIEVKYYWSAYKTVPFTNIAENPHIIYIDWHQLYDVEQYHSQILMHEAGHAMGIYEHCKKKSCLMYYKIDVWPVHVFGKKLCRGCEALL